MSTALSYTITPSTLMPLNFGIHMRARMNSIHLPNYSDRRNYFHQFFVSKDCVALNVRMIVDDEFKGCGRKLQWSFRPSVRINSSYYSTEITDYCIEHSSPCVQEPALHPILGQSSPVHIPHNVLERCISTFFFLS
jgi:hypothetical protein